MVCLSYCSVRSAGGSRMNLYIIIDHSFLLYHDRFEDFVAYVFAQSLFAIQNEISMVDMSTASNLHITQNQVQIYYSVKKVSCTSTLPSTQGAIIDGSARGQVVRRLTWLKLGARKITLGNLKAAASK
eukprot:764590-Hanusia_phi.AAC.2